MHGYSTLEESAALKTDMIQRISDNLSANIYAEFDKQFGAQIVRLELEIRRLTEQLGKAVRYLAIRDAVLAKLLNGERFPVGQPDAPSFMNVFYELPTGQVAMTYSPMHFGIIDSVPLAHENPWDGHTEEEAYQRLADFANQRLYAHVTFSKILDPIPDLGGFFQKLDAETNTP